MERPPPGPPIGSMYIVIPIIAVGALLLSSRGRPWLAMVLATLGLYAGRALLALMAKGTLGLEHTVVQPSWWIPTAIFGALALVTGLPKLRYATLQKKARRKAVSLGADESPELRRPDWARAFEVDRGWSQATSALVDIHRVTGAELHANPELLQRDVNGRVADLKAALTECLDDVADDTLSATNRLPESIYQFADQFDATWDQGANMITESERAELVVYAASRAFEVGRVLAAEPRRSLARIEALLDHASTHDPLPPSGDPNQIYALSWTGVGQAEAVVVKETRGSEEVIGLRVSWNLKGVVGADAATSIVLDARTLDPEGHLSADPEIATQGEEGARPAPIGRTCIVLPNPAQRPKKKSTKKWTQAARAKVSGSHPYAGASKADSIFVPFHNLIGGPEAVGRGTHALEAVVADYRGRGMTAAHSGVGQKALGVRGTEAVIRNVMFGDTIEAWGHAFAGAGLLKLNGLAAVGALVSGQRGLTTAEGLTFERASLRALAEWLAGVERVEVTKLKSSSFLGRELALADRYLEELRQDNVDREGDVAAHQAPAPTSLAWARACREAAAAGSWEEFDQAWAQGQAAAWTATSRSALTMLHRALPASLKPDPSTSTDPLSEGADALLRALFVVQSVATSDLSAHPAACVSLAAAEDHMVAAAVIACAHRLGDSQPVEQDLVEFAIQSELAQAWGQTRAALKSLPVGFGGPLGKLRGLVALRAARPFAQGPAAALCERVAAALISQPELLRRLTAHAFGARQESTILGDMRAVAALASATRVPTAAIRRAQAVGQLPAGEFTDVLELAVERRIISEVDVAKIRACMAGTARLWPETPGIHMDSDDVESLSAPLRQTA